VREEILKGQVVEVCVENNEVIGLKLNLDNDKQGWVPADELEYDIPQKTKESLEISRRFMGRTLIGKVIEENTDSVVLSHIDAINEVVPKKKEELEVGDVIEGIAMWVTRRDIEIEVDNCITMHIPAKEYAYSRVLDLRKEVRPGDKIKAEFVGIDEEGNLIASRKNVMPDPWKDIHERYQPRNIYLARVKGFLRNRHTSENEGVFVSLEKDIDALASPMPFFRVELDDYVAFEVSAVDSESCKIKGRLTGLAPVN
jgi:ribosomal protein S1